MKKILYLGLDAPSQDEDAEYLHFPIIQVIPKDHHLAEIKEAFQEMDNYTHLIITSKSAANFFVKNLKAFGKNPENLKTPVIAVGKKTAQTCQELGLFVVAIADEETSEGVTKVIQELNLVDPYFFWPHSALSRTVIFEFLKQFGHRFKSCAIYDTVSVYRGPLPLLYSGDEIVFTSPSCVSAFDQFYGWPSSGIILKAIGPITQEKLNSCWISKSPC